jgi:succinate-acetate transporter protein
VTDTQASTTVPPDEPATAPAIADPGPLGLGAFAMTTFVLSCFNSDIVHNAPLESVVLPLALFYGGLAQFLAGMWEFRKNNTFGALAFTSFGAFWLSFAAYVKFVVPKLPPDGVHEATGLYLLAWAIFTVYMTVVATGLSAVVLAVFTALSTTFILLTIGALGQHESVTHAGGWVGLVTAAFAWYGSFAGVANATWKNRSLPTWPLRG